MTLPTLEELDQLEKAATPGPWIPDGDAAWWIEDVGYGSEWVELPCGIKIIIPGEDTGSGRCVSRENAKSIAASRNSLRALIDIAFAARWLLEAEDWSRFVFPSEASAESLADLRAALEVFPK